MLSKTSNRIKLFSFFSSSEHISAKLAIEKEKKREEFSRPMSIAFFSFSTLSTNEISSFSFSLSRFDCLQFVMEILVTSITIETKTREQHVDEHLLSLD